MVHVSPTRGRADCRRRYRDRRMCDERFGVAGDKPVAAAGSVRQTLPARLLRWYLWLHILAGWTVTPLLFAGLSGLLRND